VLQHDTVIAVPVLHMYIRTSSIIHILVYSILSIAQLINSHLISSSHFASTGLLIPLFLLVEDRKRFSKMQRETRQHCKSSTSSYIILSRLRLLVTPLSSMTSKTPPAVLGALAKLDGSEQGK
jgi:hypothetical protein